MSQNIRYLKHYEKQYKNILKITQRRYKDIKHVVQFFGDQKSGQNKDVKNKLEFMK